MLYRKRGVEVQKRQTEMCPSEWRMRIRMAEKERVLYPMGSGNFSSLETRVLQRVLRTYADWVFRKDDLTNLLKSFSGFVQIFPDKKATI